MNSSYEALKETRSSDPENARVIFYEEFGNSIEGSEYIVEVYFLSFPSSLQPTRKTLAPSRLYTGGGIMSLAAGDDMASRPAAAVVSAIADITSSGYHLLAVDGYSAIKGSTPNGKSVLSHPFVVGGYRWRIGFYPNGSNRENAGNISLSLVLDEGDIVTIEPLKVRYLFSFLDQVEKHVSSRVLAMEVREFTSHNPRWVSKAFMTREAFEQSKHLMGDSFTIRCDIVITKNGNAAAGAPPPLSVAVPPP